MTQRRARTRAHLALHACPCLVVAASIAAIVGGLAQAQAPPDPSYDIYWESGQSAAPGDGAYVGLNGAQAIKTSFLPSGPRVTPQGSGSWAWEITSAGYGRTGSVQPLESAIQEVTGNRVDYVRAGGPAEWYVNTPAGLEGWFRVTSEPEGEGRLVLAFELTSGLTSRVDGLGRILSGVDEDGVPVQLDAWTAEGATGRKLPVELQLVTDDLGATTGYELHVEAAAEDYPVTVGTVVGGPRTIGLQGGSDLAPWPGLEEERPVPLAAPANDLCAGAQTIPAAGPFPHLTTTVNLLDATLTGDPSPTCAFNNVFSRGVWYQFQPSTSDLYTFSTCSTIAPGTTRSDTVLALFTSSTSACGGTFTQIGCSDDDASCGSTLQSTLSANLTAGTTYFVLVYSWDTTAPPAASASVQMRVNRVVVPANDTCAGALTLTANRTIAATNSLASNNYTLSGTACFNGVGNVTACSAAGRDTVHSFTAPVAGSYSFKVQTTDALGGGNWVLYTTPTCPASPATITCASPVVANNRNTQIAQYLASDEIACQPLSAGQQVFVFVDECTATTTGGGYTLEVSQCFRETETNNTPATASTFGFQGTCPVEGSVNPAGEADFFGIGTPPANSRVFAIADTVQGNSTDFDVRVTTATDTLEYDDADNTTPWGSLGPNASGARLTGAASYLRVNHFNAGTIAEPYRLHAVVQPPGGDVYQSSATSEINDGTNHTLPGANAAGNNFFAGNIVNSGDFDAYRFCAAVGDVISLGIDQDPSRNNTPLNSAIFLFDANGQQLAGFDDGNTTSSTTSGAGSLTSTTPRSPGEALTWRARYTGPYYAGIAASTTGTLSGDYLYSIGVNCQNGAAQSVQLQLGKSGPAVVAAGDTITYAVHLVNNGPNVALDASMADPLPAGTTFVGITGAGTSGSWTCTVPAAGLGGTVSCVAPCFASGGVFDFFITVQVPYCRGTAPIVNTATAGSRTALAAGSVTSAPWTTSVTDDGTCDDVDACTTNDVCSGTACVGGPPLDCDDADACTIDACDGSTGCLHSVDPGATCDDDDACTTVDVCNASGACVGSDPLACDDGNPCTDDACDPETGCTHTPNTIACDDGSACTAGDTCGGGACNGTPIVCDDTNGCTDDTCGPATGCVHTDNTAPCDDGSLCTTTDVCAEGTCVGTGSALDEPNPRTNGYWKRLCHGPHSGDELTAGDAACVAAISDTFSWATSVADLCSVLQPSQPNDDTCVQNETDLMSLVLNVCKAKVCQTQEIDSQCTGNESVDQSFQMADAILASPSRTQDSCRDAKCPAEEINTGRALELNSLTLSRLAGGGGHLSWEPPYYDDGTLQPARYHVWRRVQGSMAAYTRVAEVQEPGFDDPTPGDFEYEVTPVRK